MASFNGAQYISEQIESILGQLGPDDELVIVDDASTDDTVKVIRRFSDRRIRLIEAERNQGYVRSFGRGVEASRGDYVFLTDQDDVWSDGRLTTMLGALQAADVVCGNFAVLGGGSRGRVRHLRSADSARPLRNLVGILVGYRPYYGCAMAMTRRHANLFMPTPSFLSESHDLWLAILGNMSRTIVHLDDTVLYRRLHGNNQTPDGWRSLGKILKARIMLLRCLIEAWKRTHKVTA